MKTNDNMPIPPKGRIIREEFCNPAVILRLIILCVGLAIGFGVGRYTAPRTEEIVELTIVVPQAGRYGYSDQMSILYSFGVELAGRYWNRFPTSRYWLKPYIEAFAADSTFRINVNQKIRFKE